MSNQAPRLRLKGIAKRFDEVVAVQPLNLEVFAGQFVVFLGSVGSGKSTTLRLIAGLDAPTQGQVFLDEKDVTDLGSEQRNLAFVFSKPILYPHFTVGENIAFPLQAQKVKAKEIVTRRKEILEKFELVSIAQHKPAELNEEQQRRVSLARALIQNPKAFLFDEPLGRLSGPHRGEILKWIRSFHQERHSTTLMATQNPAEALALADYLVVMREGRILQAGIPRQVYDFPAHLFVADLMETRGMNLLPGLRRGEWIELHETPLRIRVGDSAGQLAEGFRKRSGELPCILGVRPEHLVVSEEGFPCEVEHTEFAGSYNMLHVKIGKNRLRAWLPSRIKFNVGESIHLMVIPSGCRWFQAATGDALPWKALEAVCQPTK